MGVLEFGASQGPKFQELMILTPNGCQIREASPWLPPLHVASPRLRRFSCVELRRSRVGLWMATPHASVLPQQPGPGILEAILA